MPRFRPVDGPELVKLVFWAAGEGAAIEIVGGGSKRGVGRPVEAAHVLDVSALKGVEAYEPEELVLTAKPGTPLVEIERLLERSQQMLAFEPGDWGKLLGGEPG